MARSIFFDSKDLLILGQQAALLRSDRFVAVFIV
jgi:hypothetical protein